MIWVHTEAHEPPDKDRPYYSTCAYCESELLIKNLEGCRMKLPRDIESHHEKTIREMAEAHGDYLLEEMEIQDVVEGDADGHYCPICGWWLIYRTIWISSMQQLWQASYQTAGSLRHLDPADIREPVSDIRQYLSARYEARHELHPRKLEEVVNSVFRSHGYHTELTSFSRDGGVDIVMRDSNEELLAVQVKRYRDSIEIGQIRDFLGAMVLDGYTRGIFVTTSRFQGGAEGLRRKAAVRGIQLELMDAAKLFDLLKLSQAADFESYPDFSKFADFNNPSTFTFSYQGHMNGF